MLSRPSSVPRIKMPLGMLTSKRSKIMFLRLPHAVTSTWSRDAIGHIDKPMVRRHVKIISLWVYGDKANKLMFDIARLVTVEGLFSQEMCTYKRNSCVYLHEIHVDLHKFIIAYVHMAVSHPVLSTNFISCETDQNPRNTHTRMGTQNKQPPSSSSSFSSSSLPPCISSDPLFHLCTQSR